MPREFPEWEMTDATRQALNEQIGDRMFGGLPGIPETPEDVRQLQDRFGKDNLIQWLSGTADKSSRAWKSARDGLSRRRAGRTGIGRLWRDKFRTAGRRSRTQAVRGRGSLSVSLTANIRTSRHWDYGRTMSADLSGDALNDYLEALEAGAFEQAAMVVAEAYGIDPDVIVEIDNVTGFEADVADLFDAGEDEEE
ncbi:MAG TPA: hypothetical protein VHC18_06630 [Amycolatopsis sp.]|nr:hypothetical protein [Amycolatopsis sp.]